MSYDIRWDENADDLHEINMILLAMTTISTVLLLASILWKHDALL